MSQIIKPTAGSSGPIPPDTDLFSITNIGGTQYGSAITTGSTVEITSGNDFTFGFPYSDLVSTQLIPVLNSGYAVQNGSPIILTLPASPNQGDRISIICDASFAGPSVTLQANTGQTIRISGVSSSEGGTAANTKLGDTVELIFLENSLLWISQNANGGWILL
jgi:hypothetical protein